MILGSLFIEVNQNLRLMYYIVLHLIQQKKSDLIQFSWLRIQLFFGDSS